MPLARCCRVAFPACRDQLYLYFIIGDVGENGILDSDRSVQSGMLD